MEKWNARRNEGVYIDAHTDKSGKDHVSFYDEDPSDSSHSSIHVNWDSETGKGSIVDTTSGDKESTDISCFLQQFSWDIFKINLMIIVMN